MRKLFWAFSLLWAQGEIWPGRILFELKPGFSVHELPSELVELRAWVGGEIRERFPALSTKLSSQSPIYVLEYQVPLSPVYVAKLWQRSPAVAYAEPEYIPQAFGACSSELSPERVAYTPNDVHPQNYCLSHLRVFGAWDSTKGDTTVVVAIVDTDVRFDHDDLVGNIAYNWDDPVNGVDDDGDGYVDNFHGWDLIGATYSGSGPFSPDNDPRTANPGHGTWVAGYAGATTDNGIGMAAPAFKCRILPIKAAPDDSWALYGAYDGVLYAAQQGAKVINCSWGGTFRSQAAQNFLSSIVSTYDPVIVAAAGNVPPDTPAVFYPANYDGVVSVTAVNTSDVWNGYVQIGYGLDLCTTGEGITTTGLNTYFSFGAVTSFASPQAAGCAALLRAWRPDLNARQIAELLRITADSVEPANPPHLRYRLGRRINLHRAILTQDTPACRVTVWQTYDTNDSLFFVGEQFFLLPTYINYLSPATNLTVTLESLTPHLQVVSGTYGVGTLGTLQTHSQSAANPFVLQVLPSCPPNASLPVLFRFQADGGYSDYQVVELRGINPAFAHLDSAQLRTTVCGNARVGYYDPPANTRGRGARWTGSPDSWLFEGGLFIIDDTSAHLSTRAPVGGMYSHFSPTQAATHTVQGLYEIAEVASIVSGGISAPKPFLLQTRAYALRHEPINPFVAFLYRLENYSPTQDYADLSVGWWLDPDVGINPATDRAAIHSSLPMVYARNSSGNRFIGAVLLSGQTWVAKVGRADTFTAAPPVYIGLARQSGGASTAMGDVFILLSAQGISLPAGGVDTVALALVGGYTLSELEESAQIALDWYACFIQGAGPLVDLGPDRSICAGDSLQAPPGALAYIWSQGSTASMLYPSQSGTYWVLVQDAQNCWGYDEVSLNVETLSPAQVAFSPGLTLTPGETLQGVEQSGVPYQYAWYVETPSGWQTYTGSSFSQLYSTVGTYTIRLRRTDPTTGCSDSLSWQVVVSTSTVLEGSKRGEVILYPVPAQGGFFLGYPAEMEEAFIRVWTLTGELVWEASLRPSGSWYALPSMLPAGTYLWEVGRFRGHFVYFP